MANEKGRNGKTNNGKGKGQDEVSFEIVEPIGVLARYSTGWTKEVNLVSWNGGPTKFDIRDWAEDREHMSRGVTLHPEEVEKLVELLVARNGSEDQPQG